MGIKVTMKPEMIVEEYRKAKNKGTTIKLLADMNHTTVDEITEILRENGARPRKAMMEISGAPDPEEKKEEPKQEKAVAAEGIPEIVKAALKEKVDRLNYFISVYESGIRKWRKEILQVQDYIRSVGVSMDELMK